MEKSFRKATVVLLIDNEGKVCLARKKNAIHHEDGEIEYSLGMYNGYGGKKEDEDVTILDTAIRELEEEGGVSTRKENLELVARVYFYLKKEEQFEPFMEVYFYFLRVWSGTPLEGKEMATPTFFKSSALPYDEMMPADKILFEKMLSGEFGVYEVKLLGKNLQPEITILEEKL